MTVELLTLEQTCAAIHMTPATFRQHHYKRQFSKIPPMVKKGNKWLILKHKLDEWILTQYGG